MGSFANTLFSVLLGWVQSAVSWLWKLCGTEDAGSLMSWVLDNWVLLLILLCVCGVAIDLIVYLIRWQPYRVWHSFWNRMMGRAKEEEAPQSASQPLQARHWVYADGSTAVEQEEPETRQAPDLYGQTAFQDMQLEAPVRSGRRVTPARRRRSADGSEEFLLSDLGGEHQAYHKPYYPPQWRAEAKEDHEGEDA